MATLGSNSKQKKSSKNRPSHSSGGTPSKRKRPLTTILNTDCCPPPDVHVDSPIEIDAAQNITINDEVLVTPLPEKPPAIFKDPCFVHSSKGSAGGKRTRLWKNLKQIISGDRLLPWQPTDVTYGSIDAPPSFKPGKKYSDLSGLQANYVDPQTKIRYATSEEFSQVRILPGDIVIGYLALRKANTPVP